MVYFLTNEIITEALGAAMKILYLMRHAKSSWKDTELEDHRRPLNNRGKRNVPLMGKRLKARSVLLDRIVTSDARRALDTAIPIGNLFGLDSSGILQAPLLYLASHGQILEIVKGLKANWQQVMIVGHNPGLQDAANLFYTPPISKLPTAGIVTLGFEIDKWREIDQRRLIFSDFDFPKRV
jgi:phosphohistidine phosphatase